MDNRFNIDEQAVISKAESLVSRKMIFKDRVGFYSTEDFPEPSGEKFAFEIPLVDNIDTNDLVATELAIILLSLGLKKLADGYMPLQIQLNNLSASVLGDILLVEVYADISDRVVKVESFKDGNVTKFTTTFKGTIDLGSKR